MKAIWNNQIIAESKNTIIVEGNHYFPADSIKAAFFVNSDHQSTCPYKGIASYYTIAVNGEENQNAAWYYPTPQTGYEKITGYIAFWKGVKVEG